MNYNLEAEQGLLGTLLGRNSIYDDISNIVKAKDFYHPAHQDIYAAISAEIENGNNCDAIIIAQKFKENPELEKAGGEKYIHDLQSQVPFISNYRDYAQAIAKKAYERHIIKVINSMKDEIERGDTYTIDEMVNNLDGILFGALGDSKEGVTAAQALEDAFKWILEAKAGKQVTYSTGLKYLDKLIGGFRPKGLYVIGARPGMGKTALALSMAQIVALKNPVKIFSLEMPHNELMMRLLADRTEIEVEKQMSGSINENEMQRLLAANNALATLPIHIDERSGIDVNYIVSESRKFARKNPNCTIFIDYLGLIRGDNKINKVHQIEQITTRLKTLAKEINAPVVLLSQLSRSLESREDKRPLLSDLRDSGSIEQDADVVMFVYREEEYLLKNPPARLPNEGDQRYAQKVTEYEDALNRCRGQAQIIVAKNRQGRSGVAHVNFSGTRQRFYDE